MQNDELKKLEELIGKIKDPSIDINETMEIIKKSFKLVNSYEEKLNELKTKTQEHIVDKIPK